MSGNKTKSDGGPPVKPKRGRKKHTKSRPTSDRPSVPKAIFRTVNSDWTLSEKRLLLKALRECTCEEELPNVYQQIPGRSPEDVEAAVNIFRQRPITHRPNMEAPIETWMDLCDELIHYEPEDHSQCLSRAMSIVANYEHFDFKKGEPNYKNIYRYISAILGQNEAPKLSPLDSLVMVELMHTLVDVLSETDTRTQRAVMKWKYSMLSCKVDINKLRESSDRTRRALNNVFPEDIFNFNKDQTSETEPKSSPSHVGQSPSKPSTSHVGQSPSKSGPSHDGQSPSKPGPSHEGQSPSKPGLSHEEKSPSKLGPSHEEKSPSKPGPSHEGRSSPKPSPSHRGQSPSKHGPSHEGRSPSKPGPSHEGQSMVKPAQGSNGGQSDVSSSRSTRSGEITPTIHDGNTSEQNGPQPDSEEPPAKRRRGNQTERPLERPQLYTLNPFCVPVDVLKLPKPKKLIKKSKQAYRYV